jgi:Flp pilus assembly protein TadG
MKKQRGLAAVEFVIAIPILIVLLLSIAVFGHAFYQYNTLTKSVRDGAKYLAVNAKEGSTGVINLGQTGPDGVVSTAAKNIVVYGVAVNTGSPIISDLTTGDIEVAKVDNFHVRVTATYAYVPIVSAIPGISLPATFTLTASVVMRVI